MTSMAPAIPTDDPTTGSTGTNAWARTCGASAKRAD